MQNINSETSLRDAILQLESNRAVEGFKLKEQFHLTIDSMKPVNLIKSTFQDAVASLDVKDNLIGTSVGLAAGFLAKILVNSVMKSPVHRLIGTVAMFGITKIVAKNPETLKSLGKGFLNIIRSKQGRQVHSA